MLIQDRYSNRLSQDSGKITISSTNGRTKPKVEELMFPTMMRSCPVVMFQSQAIIFIIRVEYRQMG